MELSPITNQPYGFPIQWLLVLSGSAVAGSFDVATGDALFAQSDRVDIHPGIIGMTGLVAYTGGDPIPHFLQRLAPPDSIDVRRPLEAQAPTASTPAKAAAQSGSLDTLK